MSEYIVIWQDKEGNIWETAELSLKEAKRFASNVVLQGGTIVSLDHYKNWTHLENFTI